MDISRRSLITGSAATAALGAAGVSSLGSFGASASPLTSSRLPAPADAGFDHVVVVMMENRSFDHFLGWLPGSDGIQAGLKFRDRYGVKHPTYRLGTYGSCGYVDPDHSFEGGRAELHKGRNDGWLISGENDLLSIGYYTEDDLDFFKVAAPAFTTCDRYFSAIMAETYPNRFYMHSAQTDRLHNNTDQAMMPTIWDRLSGAGLGGTYYFSDIPFTALWYEKYESISKPFPQFLADAAAGTLPEVSFVDPRFNGEGDGVSGDDHPHADIRAGQQFMAQVYTAVTTGAAWDRTLLIFNYDEWGGFYDHVKPGRAPDAHPTGHLRGFRVPCLVVSPLARRGHVAHRTYDHTSVLKAIEWRWDLEPLTKRDAAARNLAEVLDFESTPDLTAPAITVPNFTPQAPCEIPTTGMPSAESEWGQLLTLATDLGWNLPR